MNQLTAASTSRIPGWLAVVAAIVCGMLTALQSRINGQLAVRIDDAYLAATISFGSGLVLLIAVVALSRRGRGGFRRVAQALRDRTLRWWMILGGLAGAWFVMTQGLAAGVVGVALFTVAIVAGQTLGGVLFDVLGIGPGGRRPLTPTRIIGAALALVAIAWAVSGRIGEPGAVWLLVLPLLAGLGAAWQQAMNGRVRVVADSALTATGMNFLVGSVALVVAMLVHATSAGFPNQMPGEAWLYTGGAIGCVFIAGQALVVRRIGVLVLALSGVAGQLVAALALDVLVPTASTSIDFATVGGTSLALLAVVIASAHVRLPPKPAERVSSRS